MKQWCEIVRDIAVAKTINSFDNVDSPQDGVKIENKEGRYLHGFIVLYSQGIVTDAENWPDIILRVSNKTLGISEEDIVIPQGSNDGDAASGYVPVRAVFVPFKQPPGTEGKMYGSTFKFDVAPTVTNTGGVDIIIGVVYGDSPLALDDKIQWLALPPVPMNEGGVYNNDAAKAHGTASTAVPLSALTLPSGVKAIVGHFAKIRPNGITAEDGIVGHMSFSSTGLGNYVPQNWPFCVAFNPALGTVTDGLNGAAEGFYWPSRFDLDSKIDGEVSISVSSELLEAAGTAPDTVQAVLYEKEN